MRVVVLLGLLVACGDKSKCPAATAAASKAVWAYNPVDRLVNDAWTASITLEKALDEDVYRTTEKAEGNCHEIDRALAHPKDADVELLRRSAHAFRSEVDELVTDNTEPPDPHVLEQLLLAAVPFDDALAIIPVRTDVAPHPPDATSTPQLQALSKAWCSFETSYHAALASRLDHLHAEQTKNKADIAKYGAQAKAQSAHWTAAQDFGRVIDGKPSFPLTAPGDLATEPGFASARAALDVANKACN